jgi:hypothetical protein
LGGVGAGIDAATGLKLDAKSIKTPGIGKMMKAPGLAGAAILGGGLLAGWLMNKGKAKSVLPANVPAKALALRSETPGWARPSLQLADIGERYSRQVKHVPD